MGNLPLVGVRAAAWECCWWSCSRNLPNIAVGTADNADTAAVVAASFVRHRWNFGCGDCDRCFLWRNDEWMYDAALAAGRDL